MKKFCDKIAKQQWRVSVPNVNGKKLFKGKVLSSSASVTDDDENCAKARCGSYDLRQAEKSFEERCHSELHQVTVVTIASDSSDSESTDEAYEDARAAMSDRSENLGEIYADPSSPRSTVISDSLSEANSRFEYDVPKISFSFFESQKSDEEEEECGEDRQGDYEVVEVKSRVKSAVRITLAMPESDRLSVSGSEMSNSEVYEETSTVEMQVSGNPSETNTEVILKSGSDPNLSHHSDEDDGFYKVPRSHSHIYRISQSLDNLSVDNEEEIRPSAVAPSEQVTRSQIIVEKATAEHAEEDNKLNSLNSITLDYCKARSKLPANVRRVTLLRKPKTKAVKTWTQIRTKVNNILTEHAAQQRVGAFDDKEKTGLDLESVYKNSKNKCKKVLKSTGKIFSARPKKTANQENHDPNCDASSQIVKNDAFFARVEIKASDIEYKFDRGAEDCDGTKINGGSDVSDCGDKIRVVTGAASEEKKDEFDFSTLKHAFRRSKLMEGQNGFDDLRRYVKQGGDFCKELSAILQERAEAETQYAKSLSKLSNKLARACRENVGGLNDAWKAVAIELEARAEGHRLIGNALLEEAARPLRTLTENQHRARKQAETSVDKAARGLADWRAAEAKSKKHSHTCARDNEKLQDATLEAKLSRSTSLIHLAHLHNHKAVSDKENAKLEGKKRKAEDAVKKADIEYYTLCVRAERARLEWESAVLRGTSTFQALEEERLNNLKTVLTSYLQHSSELCPRLAEAIEKLKEPIAEAEPAKDLTTFVSLRQSSQQISEQLLPDFYCEHITLAMNRERRKQALVKLLHLIRQDIERERKSKNGLENLSKAIKQTPNFGAEDSQQSVTEKLYHMKSMLTYLEGARYKVQSALAELDSRPRAGHPLAPHITITRDKSGLQQSVLKVPQWLRDEWTEPDRSPLSEKSSKSDLTINEVDLADPDWTDRGTADGNSNQPDSDFDEFSSQGSSTDVDVCNGEDTAVQPIAKCKALYAYTPNLPDELSLRPGDILSVYRQQEDGWWLGECNGSVGIFPATYVETIPVVATN